jgi:hypothetical protein
MLKSWRPTQQCGVTSADTPPPPRAYPWRSSCQLEIYYKECLYQLDIGNSPHPVRHACKEQKTLKLTWYKSLDNVQQLTLSLTRSRIWRERTMTIPSQIRDPGSDKVKVLVPENLEQCLLIKQKTDLLQVCSVKESISTSITMPEAVKLLRGIGRHITWYTSLWKFHN